MVITSSLAGETGSATSGSLSTAIAGVASTARSESATSDSPLTETAGGPVAPASQEKKDELEALVVTGSRIVRDGYQAPTPVTVLGADQINAMAVNNISDAVNRLPVFLDSSTAADTSISASSGYSGINQLDLRGLGANRTLVLLDGKRVVPAVLSGFEMNGGAPDINTFPSGLVSRVEVVTGGASAVYGSDALAGVVNFVLDKNFTGLKTSVEGGVTTYGDDGNYKLSLTGGTPFADGRGHFLIFGEDAFNAGIASNTRPWNNSYQLMANPAYGTGPGQSTTVPQLITAANAGLSVATLGGLVVSGPLRGTQFVNGGTPIPFNFGSVSGIQMSGGDWATSRIDNQTTLDPQLKRDNFYSRVSYDLTDNINAYSEFGWGRSQATVPQDTRIFDLGNVTVLSGNPFIPASIQARMTALGLPSFALGTTNGDLPGLGAENTRIFNRYVEGLEGSFNAFTSKWKWEAYYARSTDHINAYTTGDNITANYFQAVDAVLDPNGRIVCRSTLTNPTNGCVPYNVMGTNVNSPQAINYVVGDGHTIQDLSQDVFGFNMTGEPFRSWAGPISLAFDLEHRREAVEGTASPISQDNGFFAGNFKAESGAYRVTEGALETVIPLAKDVPWAKTFDVNGAFRATEYSASGYVTTWKVGLSYQPIDDLRFRATRSRDIRAPNLGDLYEAGRPATGTVVDPLTGATYNTLTLTGGNPHLKPEDADTTGFGVVYTSSKVPGLAASVDFYNINITNAITALGTQEYVDRCYAGETQLCAFIQRDPTTGLISHVDIEPANILSQETRGIDFEASYVLQLSSVVAQWTGNLTFRGLATRVLKLQSQDQNLVTNGVGVNADGQAILGNSLPYGPSLRWTVSETYDNRFVSATVTGRGIGSGVYNNSFIQCTSACPTPGPGETTINNNYIPAVAYLDLSFTYKFLDGAGEAFFVAENALNQSPPQIAGSTNDGFFAGQANSRFYDRLGRNFHMGVRFKLGSENGRH
jgi:iron complex outermembrane receptor protein